MQGKRGAAYSTMTATYSSAISRACILLFGHSFFFLYSYLPAPSFSFSCFFLGALHIGHSLGKGYIVRLYGDSVIAGHGVLERVPTRLPISNLRYFSMVGYVGRQPLAFRTREDGFDRIGIASAGVRAGRQCVELMHHFRYLQMLLCDAVGIYCVSRAVGSR